MNVHSSNNINSSNISPLSNFAQNAKAVDKKSIYKRALNAAKEEQLLMIKQSKIIHSCVAV